MAFEMRPFTIAWWSNKLPSNSSRRRTYKLLKAVHFPPFLIARTACGRASSSVRSDAKAQTESTANAEILRISLKMETSLRTHCFPTSRHQLPQHVLQNPAVCVVQSFSRRINPDEGPEFFHSAGTGRVHFQMLPRGKFIGQLTNAADLENFIARESERVRGLSGYELQRQNTHPHQIRAVNSLITFRNYGMNPQQVRPFGRPVTRGA